MLFFILAGMVIGATGAGLFALAVGLSIWFDSKKAAALATKGRFLWWRAGE
jgi:hypothetical protein